MYTHTGVTWVMGRIKLRRKEKSLKTGQVLSNKNKRAHESRSEERLWTKKRVDLTTM